MEWWITVIFVATALALPSLWVARRRRKAATVRSEPSPMGLALKNLRLARAQISDSNFLEFSKLLSRAMRIYILSAYKLPSPRITSEEIIDRLLANASNDWRIIGLLAEILKLTDSVKYSKRRLSLPQQRGIYKKACSFVLLSERFFRRIGPRGRGSSVDIF